jgi:hypothetical protein
MTNILDLNTADKQRDLDIIPDGTICTVQMTVRPGGVGDGGWLKRSKPNKNGNCSDGLDCEFVVTDGPFAKRHFWQLFTLDGQDIQPIAGEISRRHLRAIVESARGIKPDDESDAAKAARRLTGWGDLNKLRFVVKIGVEPPQNGYKAKNKIDQVITPDRQDWKQIEQIAQSTNGAAAPTAAPNAQSAEPPAGQIVRPEWATKKVG